MTESASSFSYTIPLGDGEGVTHYAARAEVSAQFIGWVRGHEPLPAPAAPPVIDALIADFSPEAETPDAPSLRSRAHLDRVPEATKLSVVPATAA